MKSNFFLSVILVGFIATLSGCEAIETIFKAGVWSGVLMVAIVIALIIFIFTRIGSKK